MPTCDVCGNDKDTFTITHGTTSGTFDSFECAAHAMAPTCAHCGCRILGHAHRVDGVTYCCPHCAEQAGDAASAAINPEGVPDKQIGRWKDDGGAVMP